MACDDTQKDPNLADQCVFINDGPSPAPWLSPDIDLNGFTDKATVGSNNTVDITVHRGADTNCPTLTASQNIVVEVWVTNPGMSMSPFASKNIGTKLIPKAQLPVNGSRSLSQALQLINWTPGSTNTNDPDGPGHRCLIARCYPEADGPPDTDCFHVMADAHVAQRNINIVQVPMGRPLIAQIHTGNFNTEHPQLATFRALADVAPNRKMLDVLNPVLHKAGGFQQVVRTSPLSFAMKLRDVSIMRVRDKSRPGFLNALSRFSFTPRFEADVRLKAGQATHFEFTANLGRARRGDAHIFHLTHLRNDRRVIGGLTLIAIVS